MSVVLGCFESFPTWIGRLWQWQSMGICAREREGIRSESERANSERPGAAVAVADAAVA